MENATTVTIELTQEYPKQKNRSNGTAAGGSSGSRKVKEI